MTSTYQTPLRITASILNAVAEIGELLGRWSACQGDLSPQLRRENRIRTIQASLAIEHNSLSLEQVTAVLDGKRVHNAFAAYEQLPNWQASNGEHLLAAHALLMQGLVDRPGQWRDGGVGIFRDNVLLHMAPPANQIPRLMRDLLGWLAHTDSHPLIASCVFHYELEFIHPFSDGNGRLGRLWQTLILSQWRSAMAYLPVESIIREEQEAYYRVLGEADKASDCRVFIEFMLQALLAALQAGIETAVPTTVSGQMPVKMSGKTAETILQALRLVPNLTIPQLAEQTGSSTRTVERQLKLLQQQNLITRIGPKKSGHWHVL